MLYTLNQSLFAGLRRNHQSDPMEIVEVGVNEASVFKGFCPTHDTSLFAPAETTDERKKSGLARSLHLRAISLEYCRKRQVVDQLKIIIEMSTSVDVLHLYRDAIRSYEASAANISAYLYKYLLHGSDCNHWPIDYFLIPFSKNINVSCCGVFNHLKLRHLPIIAYNVVSYASDTMLALTTLGDSHATMNSFLADYRSNNGVERLVNDIVFRKGEEPLISARLWRSLSDSEKLDIRLSLVHPSYRSLEMAPRIVKLVPTDFLTDMTPTVVTRLGHLEGIVAFPTGLPNA